MPKADEMVTVPANTLHGMVHYIGKTQPLLKEQGEKRASVANKAPVVVDKLIKAGALTADKKAQALDALKDPEKQLVFIDKLAELVIRTKDQAKQAEAKSSMGRADDIVTPRVRVTDEIESPANQKFLEAFGL